MEEVFDSHPAYNVQNPNSNYSLIGGFCGNLGEFHALDADGNGPGYAYVAKKIAQLDKINPQVASRFCKVFARFRQYEPVRGGLMKGQLESLLSTDGLSENSKEIITLALAEP